MFLFETYLPALATVYPLMLRKTKDVQAKINTCFSFHGGWGFSEVKERCIFSKLGLLQSNGYNNKIFNLSNFIGHYLLWRKQKAVSLKTAYSQIIF